MKCARCNTELQKIEKDNGFSYKCITCGIEGEPATSSGKALKNYINALVEFKKNTNS